MLRRFVPTIIEAIFGVIELLLGLRIILKLFGASTNAPFVTWVYTTSDPLLAPFEGMFPTSALGPGLVLEVSALFALVVYSFVSFLLERVVTTLSDEPVSKRSR